MTSEETAEESDVAKAVEPSGAGIRDVETVPHPGPTLGYILEAVRESWTRVPPMKARRFAWPFYIKEQDLKKLNRRARAGLKAQGVKVVYFSIEVRYSDYGTVTYSSLKECFEKATDGADAESVVVTWRGVAENERIAEIRCEFITEKPLDTYYDRGPAIESVGISLRVEGGNRDWIDTTFGEISSLLENYRLPRIYRVLELFARTQVRVTVGWLVGAAIFYLALVSLNTLINTPGHEQPMASILSKATLEGKFDEFVRQYYAPHASIALGLVAFLVPYGLLLGVPFVVNKLLVNLVPRSFINIGATKRRSADYYNLLKFVVFGVLVALLLGVIGSIVATALLSFFFS